MLLVIFRLIFARWERAGLAVVRLAMFCAVPSCKGYCGDDSRSKPYGEPDKVQYCR